MGQAMQPVIFSGKKLRRKPSPIMLDHFGIAQIGGQFVGKHAQASSAAPSPMRIMLSSVMPAMCGVTITLSKPK